MGTTKSWHSHTVSYLQNLIRDKNIASVTPSSRFAVQKVCDRMNLGGAQVIVEYGPGMGVFTRYMLERMSPEALLIALDTNERFINFLTDSFTDRRLRLFLRSAELVRETVVECGATQADYIISGIPFSMLPPEVASTIVGNTMEVLRPGGKFLVYQFLRPIGKRTPGIHRHLPKYFTQIQKLVELRNVPPLIIYEATKV